MRAPHLHGHVELPDDVLLSVEGVSKAAAKPDWQPPRWAARFLPGVQWSATGGQTSFEEDVEDDLDEDEDSVREGALQDVSFQLASGEALGLVGDQKATRTLITLLAGLYPPTSGRIVVRGRIVPVIRFSELNVSSATGRKSLKVLSRFLRWPPDFLKRRWREIVEFAHLEELEGLGFVPGSIEYEEAKTKRLMLSALMHVDATVYAVVRSFAGSDEAMYERCCEVIQQRRRDGCAIVFMGKQIEDLVPFCHEAILFQDGAAVFRGRLGEVAHWVAEKRAEARRKRERPFSLRALLVGDESEVTVGTDGGTIQIELDVFKRLDARLRLRLTDADGRETELEHPHLFTAEPGIYRLAIPVPGGALDDTVYTATLLAARDAGDDGDEPAAAQELLTFGVRSANGASAPEPVPEFGVLPEFGVVANGDGADVDEDQRPREWDVRRVSA